ncbi:helix-turn-helix domain-containing protein [Streptomyces sp. NPDC088745]|uniref:helix-turn-helix domain-containing protein n=1 Tax=Streptomyces sp. NPDC088745 TaxID=3365884 RepID=UPI00381FE85C
MTAGQIAGPAGRMQIARALRSLRARAGLTQSQAAQLAGVSVGTVNRYEMWQDRALLRVPTVRTLADAYQATPDEREALTELVKAQASGWWMTVPHVPEILDPLLSFEGACEYEHVYAPALVPGLLQTPRYAHALHQAQDSRAAPEDVEGSVRARMQRQEILKRPDLHLWVVLDQAVLLRQVGGADVMGEQLDHLLTMSSARNVDLQVLPFGAAAKPAGSGGHFVIVGRDDVGNPLESFAIIYLELHRRGLYLDSPDDVAEYKIMFDYLRSTAANAAASADLLTAARQEYR